MNIDRRNFLKSTIAVGAALATGGTAISHAASLSGNTIRVFVPAGCKMELRGGNYDEILCHGELIFREDASIKNLILGKSAKFSVINWSDSKEVVAEVGTVVLSDDNERSLMFCSPEFRELIESGIAI